MRRWRTISVVCAGSLVLASAAVAQRRIPGDKKPTVAVVIALKAGAEAYQFNGQATCTHAPVASIYQVVSEQWMVQQSDGARSLQLTFWKPKNGSPEMFSLSLSAGRGTHTVDTVNVGAAKPQGSGTATLATAGGGGTFTISAKAADASAITGTIKCDAFTAATAEGGE